MKKIITLFLNLAVVSAMNATQTTTTNVAFKIIDATYDYCVDRDARIYTSCPISIDWPQRIGNYDITGFQAAISNVPITYFRGEYGNPSPESIMKACSKAFEEGEPVASIPATRAKTSDNYPFGAPEYSMKLSYDWFDPSTSIIAYTFTYVKDNHSGTGAGISEYQESIYYNFNKGTNVGLNHLLTGDWHPVALKAIREYCAENVECLLIEPNEIELPIQWRIDTHNGAIVFWYQKYNIACGATGNVEVPVYAWQLESYLTPLARKLLSY